MTGDWIHKLHISPDDAKTEEQTSILFVTVGSRGDIYEFLCRVNRHVAVGTVNVELTEGCERQVDGKFLGEYRGRRVYSMTMKDLVGELEKHWRELDAQA